MRTLVVLAILAASLTRHIFTTTYLLKEDSELRHILLELAETNSSKEAFCRKLLLSISEEKEIHGSQERIATVVREVLHRIQYLAVPDALERFRSELQPVVETAAQTWRKIQKRRSHFEAEDNPKLDDQGEWQAIEFNEDDIGIAAPIILAAGFASDEVALVVFPRVVKVDDQVDTPVFPGVVLRKSQTVAASQEVEQIKTSSPSLDKVQPTRPTRTRRMSLGGIGQHGTRRVEVGNILG